MDDGSRPGRGCRDGPLRDPPAAGVLRRVKEEAWRPFNLETGPLVRATLLRLGEREHALAL